MKFLILLLYTRFQLKKTELSESIIVKIFVFYCTDFILNTFIVHILLRQKIQLNTKSPINILRKII